MNDVTSPVLAVVVVGAVMMAGTYTVAVLNTLVGVAVSGDRVRWGRAVAGPVRTAALMLVQQRQSTEKNDAPGWLIAPALLAALAAVSLALVPLGPDLVAADPETGFVVFSSAIAFVMIAVYLHGWSPNSAFPMHGAYRYSAQALSLQIPFLVAMLATVLPAESMSIVDIVQAQESLWNVIRQPLGLPIYLMAAASVSFWGPLNLPDAADLAEGTSAEDSGVARLLWQVARASMLFALAAMGAAGFLGGWWGPWLPGFVWVILKTLALLLILVFAGHTLARVRIEKMVVVAWAVLIPLALVNIFVSGVFLL